MGHCGDNAACEGFLGLLMHEWIYRTSCLTLDAARADVFDYIQRRQHSRTQRWVGRQNQKVAALFEPSVISGRGLISVSSAIAVSYHLNW